MIFVCIAFINFNILLYKMYSVWLHKIHNRNAIPTKLWHSTCYDFNFFACNFLEISRLKAVSILNIKRIILNAILKKIIQIWQFSYPFLHPHELMEYFFLLWFPTQADSIPSLGVAIYESPLRERSLMTSCCERGGGLKMVIFAWRHLLKAPHGKIKKKPERLLNLACPTNI